MTFRTDAQAAALAWKHDSLLLPEAARPAAAYGHGKGPALDVCLPPAFAAYNLLPDARELALDRFARAGVNWHHGTTAMCGNHLLSSRIQCTNALAPMLNDHDALKTTFGGILPIAEVLAFGDPDTDPADRVSFEWIGLKDHLGEHAGKIRSRGANTTSADAAIRYRTPSNEIEIALIEWKYVEHYTGGPLSGGESGWMVRHRRYLKLWHDPSGPVRVDVVPYEDMFVEPFYQLFRLQQLAHAMEKTNELGATRVRLVYAAQAANAELWGSLHRTSWKAAGPDVASAWSNVLRRPDRFAYFDTGRLVTPDTPTSDAFKVRYAHIAKPPDAGKPTPPTCSDDDTRAVISRLRAALETAQAMLLRVGGEGSVLETISAAADAELMRVPSAALTELAARAEEASELVRILRAVPASVVLDRLAEDQ